MYTVTERGYQTPDGLYVMSFQCDLISDVATLPKRFTDGLLKDDYVRVASGSGCFCMENSKLYRLRCIDDTWAIPTSV